MMLIEFTGCPGIGKTTLCRLVMEKLEKEGTAVHNIFKDELALSDLKKKVFGAKYRSYSKGKDLRNELKNFLNDYPGPEPEKWGKEILKVQYKLDKYGDSKGLLFADEGPTQFLTSIVHMQELNQKADGLIAEMDRAIYSKPVLLFDIQISEEINVKRLTERGQDNHRFLREKDMDLDSMMEIKRRNLDFAIERLNYAERHVIINDDLERAGNEIADYIKSFRGRS